VAEPVVDALETVEVEHRHLRRAPGHRGGEPLLEEAAVGQPGQVVEHGEVPQLPRLPLHLGDETGHPQQDQHEQQHRADPDRQPAQVREAQRALDEQQGGHEQGAAGEQDEPARADA
jgi:hypothetical protein